MIFSTCGFVWEKFDYQGANPFLLFTFGLSALKVLSFFTEDIPSAEDLFHDRRISQLTVCSFFNLKCLSWLNNISLS